MVQRGHGRLLGWQRLWRSGLSLLHGLRGDWNRAAAEIAVAAEAAPEDALAWFLLGEFRSRQGETGPATEAYRQVLRLRPDLARAQAALGRVLLRAGQAQEAHRWLSRAVSSEPRVGAWWEDLGTAAAAIGLYPEALAHLNHAAALGERSESLSDLRALVLARLGHYRDAAAGLRRAVLRTPRDPVMLNNLAFCLAGDGQLENALHYYLRAIALAPADADLLLNLGSCLQGLGRHAEALEYLSRLLPGEPRPEVSLALASSYLALGDPAKALHSLAPALRFSPRAFDLINMKARALLDQGDRPRAEAYYRYLRRLAADRPEPLWGLGRCRDAAGKRDEAVQLYNLAIDAEKRNTC
ncbi:MAG: tetratricopeptide repeat protein [Symbiobacteriia bacterium]